MDIHDRLEALLTAAEAIGLVVQRAPVSGEGGGLCVVKGERRLFVDTLADTQTRYQRTLEALANLDDIEKVYLPPKVRDDLEQERSSR